MLMKAIQFVIGVWKELNWMGKIVALAVLVFFPILIVSVGTVLYTSSAGFCRTCHIMQPYYDSWKSSTHNDVECIKCHFPPTLMGKVHGKLKASNQLVAYITDTYGTLPYSEVEDASCLQKGCHDLGKLDKAVVEYKGIKFEHGKHRKKLRGDKKLRCTSCHTQLIQDVHMAVPQDTCFLCHFKGEKFNEDIARCTGCHTIPNKTVTVGKVKFNHGRVEKLHFECRMCHESSLAGDGVVHPDRCKVCHNVQAFFDRIDEGDFLHDKHVTEHAVPCLSCHDRIEHSRELQYRTGPLNCAKCHPDHHADAVNILEARGAPVKAAQSPMAAVHVGCRGCHITFKTDEHKRDTTAFADAASCVACHGKGYEGRLNDWGEVLQESLADAKDSMKEAEDLMKALPENDPRTAKIKSLFNEASKHLAMVVHGNGIHNVLYADEVLSLAIDKFDEAIELAKKKGK